MLQRSTDALMGFFVSIMLKLKARLIANRNKALSCYTVEDYLTKPFVRDVATSFYETVDEHMTELYAAAYRILRIALMTLPR